MLPTTVKFLITVALIAGLAYGSVWSLANFPPEQAEIIKPLPHEKLKQQ